MGAFDLELYSLGYRFPKPSRVKECDSDSKVQTEFYVSHYGSNGGWTGKWFKDKQKAKEFYVEKSIQNLKPSNWFNWD